MVSDWGRWFYCVSFQYWAAKPFTVFRFPKQVGAHPEFLRLQQEPLSLREWDFRLAKVHCTVISVPRCTKICGRHPKAGRHLLSIWGRCNHSLGHDWQQAMDLVQIPTKPRPSASLSSYTSWWSSLPGLYRSWIRDNAINAVKSNYPAIVGIWSGLSQHYAVATKYRYR